MSISETKDNQRKLEWLLNQISKELKVKEPKIKYVDRLRTDTMLAEYSTKENVIYVKRNVPNVYDLYFSISHEMRHAWQNKYHAEEYFKGYKTVVECRDKTEYNLQIAEVDANAYAFLVMYGTFGMVPQFNGMDRQVIDRIHRRAFEMDSDGDDW